ncbi:hypothetical protein AAHA92_07148 [Salvia divinorum]|uniref:Uncharacterized protein n=1 Tax=Salvia divinorum TaxID=28513 RepID=A0ABD1I800_SALDI
MGGRPPEVEYIIPPAGTLCLVLLASHCIFQGSIVQFSLTRYTRSIHFFIALCSYSLVLDLGEFAGVLSVATLTFI